MLRDRSLRRHWAWALLLCLAGPCLAASGQAPPGSGPHGTVSSLGSAPAEVEALKTTIGLTRALLIGVVVVAIQAGFLLVAVGLTRSKNTSYTSGQVLLTSALGTVGFWACGFALMFGGVDLLSWFDEAESTHRLVSITVAGHSFGLVGLRGFFLSAGPREAEVTWVFLLQVGFLVSATVIPIGSLVERWRLRGACLFALAMATVIYPVQGCWAWGGGWLSGLGRTLGLGNGFVDFAGSGVVHLAGGTAALVGASVVGPRIGKFRKDGVPNPIPGHNIPMVVVGSLLLAASWTTLAAGGGLLTIDLNVGPMAVRGMLAASSGCLGACLYAWLFFGKPDPTLCCNGLLAGVVAIAAPCAFVSSIGAAVIGGVAGILAIAGILAVERLLRVDDPVGVVAVHGLCGGFGCIAVGLFSTGAYGKGWNGVAEVTPMGILYGGGFGQLGAQLIGVAACVAWAGVTSYLAFRVIDRLVGNRVSARVEVEGLDIPETGVLGYVAEDTHAVATAGQVYLASHGPGVPPRTSFAPPPSPPKSR